MASEAEVDLIIDTTGTLPELERDLQRIINTAEDGAPSIEVETHIDSRFSDEFLEEVRAAERIARSNPLEVEAEINLDADMAELNAELSAVVEQLEESAPEVDIQVDVDRDGQGSRGAQNLTRAFGALSGILPQVSGRMLAFGSAGVAAVPAAAALSAAIESVLPASALAVSGLTTLVLAGGTVAVAFQGVGDAITAAFDPETSPEDLAKAMEGLAPTARAFVEELRGMKGQFSDLREEVQQNFFVGFDNALRNLGQTVLPQVRSALANTAVQLNLMALSAADAAVVLAQDGTLGKALEGSRKGLENLNKVPGQFVTALGQIGAAAAPAFDRVTQAAAGAATQISERLTAAFESGALESAIDGAVDSIAQIGRVVENVFEGLGNIFETLNAQGEGLFSVLEKITAAFAEVTASQGFQQALKALAQTFGVLVDTVLPLITTALQALGPVFQSLAAPIQILVRALGEGLTRVVTALSPVLVAVGNAFGQLVILATPFIDLAADLLVALLPGLIPLFEALGQAFNALVPFAEALVGALSEALVPLFTKLAAEVLPQLLPPLIELSTKLIPLLTEVILALAPTLVTIATTFGELLIAITPVIVELLNLAIALADELLPIIQPIIDVVLKLINIAFKVLAAQITGLIIPTIRILVDLLQGDFSAAWQGIQDLIRNVAAKIGEILSAMGDRIVRILGDLGNQARAKVSEMTEAVVQKFIELGNRARDIMSRLPGIILSAVGDLGNLLRGAGADLIQGLINGISGKLGELRAMASRVADTVSGSVKDLLGISSPSRVMMEVGGDTMDGLLKGIEDKVPDLRETLQGVASLAPSFALPNGQTLQLPQFNQAAPNVQVFIGNEQLSGHVDARIARHSQARDLLITRGVRR